MKLNAAIDRLLGLSNGGVINDRARQSMTYMESVANTFRCAVIAGKYNGNRTQARNKRINPCYYIKHYPLFDSAMQDEDCVVKFLAPQVLSLDDQSDGLRYCGTIDGSCAFNRIQSRRRLSDFKHHKVAKAVMERDTAFLYDGFRGVLEIYGNKELTECLLELIPIDVSVCNQFNKDTDEFIDDTDLDQFLFQNWQMQAKIEKAT